MARIANLAELKARVDAFSTILQSAISDGNDWPVNNPASTTYNSVVHEKMARVGDAIEQAESVLAEWQGV